MRGLGALAGRQLVLSRFRPVQELLQRKVDEGRFPGFVAALRHGGSTEVLVGGRRHLDGGQPMTPDTQFRLASVSKPLAGVLALRLVERGLVGLDDPVAPWLPELAGPRVLRSPGADLDDTVPAERPITLRHLLTNTPGFGAVGPSPLGDALEATGGGPSAFPPEIGHDEFLRRLGALPLAAQPGERWLYHVASDVLSVLLSRVSGLPTSVLLAEEVAGPLGLGGTGFTGDPARLATQVHPADGGLAVLDPPAGRFAAPPVFEGLAAGLVSTAPDVLAVLTALADGGTPLLRPESARAMTSDQLTAAQRAASAEDLDPDTSWGFSVGVSYGGRPFAPGSWGWDGGTGTSAWVDPQRDLAGVLLTQRLMTGPEDAADWFWAAAVGCL